MNVSQAFNSTNSTKHMLGDHVLGNGFSITACKQPMNVNMKLLPGPLTHVDKSLTANKQGKVDSVLSTIGKLAKRKLTIGAAILQVGKAEKIFRRVFTVREGEELLKTSKCCLYTTGGPIAGRLFISTKRVAFCSKEPIAKFTYLSGESVIFCYKVSIPLRKVKRANQSENVQKPSQKYLQVITTDNFEFWFMGFLKYEKIFNFLQRIVSQVF
uniref:GRAM domain-containing protein n=1 Tax=Opuntia streptacantha TaxID=393608 RepID=A0A7C9CVM2_OPUST